MIDTLRCTISRRETVCQIIVQDGLLAETQKISALLREFADRIAIISHTGLQTQFVQPLCSRLAAAGFEVHPFYFPEGEENKSRKTKEALEDAMLAAGLGRDTCLVALGGGIVTDVAGYVAATYCRGIPLVMVPTSLIGMVDASIGGKTGVNVPQGKNLIGSIHQPSAVLMDLSVLRTLPPREVKNGIVEMIKHGLVADYAYFEWLERNAKTLLALESGPTRHAIIESCRIKTAIVSQDERECGIRGLLNYGHTVAHALERLSGYSMPHGEAVAIGLLVESRLSVEQGILSPSDYDRTRAVLTSYGLTLRIPFDVTVEGCLEAMAMDKKSLKGKPRFALLKAIGEPYHDGCVSVDDAVLEKTLKWMSDDLCSS